MPYTLSLEAMATIAAAFAVNPSIGHLEAATRAGVPYFPARKFVDRLRKLGSWRTPIYWTTCSECGQPLYYLRPRQPRIVHPACRGARNLSMRHPDEIGGRPWDSLSPGEQQMIAGTRSAAVCAVRLDTTQPRPGHCKHWTAADDEYLLAHSMEPCISIASALGRTAAAVQARRHSLIARGLLTARKRLRRSVQPPARPRPSYTPSPVAPSSLGELVRQHRLSLGLTQLQLADRGPCAVSLINRLESGRAKFLQQSDVPALATALAVPGDVIWALIPGGRTTSRWISLH